VDFTVESEVLVKSTDPFGPAREMEGRSSEEKWAFFEKQISKCIRCNACRQVCPTCYCKVCFAEQCELKWIGASTDLTDRMLFHLTRLIHQAGRCAGCDECSRACPMGVDLRIYNTKMMKDVEELFHYVADLSTDTIPPLSTYSINDTDDFITEPGE
jgi:ferredoxin